MKNSERSQQPWIKQRANYCIRYGMHPSELDIPASKQHLYALLVEQYDMRVADLRGTYEIVKQVPSRSSSSVNNIKNRTHGRNRKEQRGS